jgi:hypothetical protein
MTTARNRSRPDSRLPAAVAARIGKSTQPNTGEFKRFGK